MSCFTLIIITLELHCDLYSLLLCFIKDSCTTKPGKISTIYDYIKKKVKEEESLLRLMLEIDLRQNLNIFIIMYYLVYILYYYAYWLARIT